MERTSKVIVAVAAAAALAFGVAALAQPAPGRAAGGPGIARMMDALNLTADQKAKVQPLLDEQRTAARDLHQQMRDHRQALKAALDAAQPDPTAVGKAMLVLKADRDAAKAQRDALKAKLGKVLTPEQNAKLEGFMAGMRFGRGRGMGMRGGMRGGPGL